jgi:hypothetical protein
MSAYERDIDYEIVNDSGECRSADKRLDPSDGEYTLADCAHACADDPDGCLHFSYRPGFNSQCYAEYPSEPKAGNSYCGEGFDSDDFDFYRLMIPRSDSQSNQTSQSLSNTTNEPVEEEGENEPVEQEGEIGMYVMRNFLPVFGMLSVLGGIASLIVGLGLLALVAGRSRPLSTREVVGRYTTRGDDMVIGATAESFTKTLPRHADYTEESDFQAAGLDHQRQFCSSCGARWIDGNRFCGRCGAEGLFVGSNDERVVVV